MSTRQFGRPIKRNEDPRLLTGRALFTDDVQLAGMLHVAFLRSDLAHARIRSIDVEGASRSPGVVAVYTAADLGEFWQPGPLLVPPPPVEKLAFHERTQVPLAKDKVRHAGEAVAMVVAESRYIAEDALDDIFVDYEPLDAVTGLEAALREDAPLVHEDLGHNVSARVTQTKGSWTQAESEADLVVRRRFLYDRGTAAALENRGIVASWDEKSQRLTIWDTTQAPIAIRNGLAAMLGLSEHQVRVIAPFIGGGFGPKIMMFYPEEVLLAWAALQLGRPLKWIEDREENFYATTQERGQVHDAAIALKSDGTILGVKDQFLHDAGAYAPYGLTLPISSQCTLLGPYVVPSYHSEFSSVFTNKPIVTPYRGAGRQHGVFVMERLLDIAAKELDIDLVEIRRRNFIPPDRFPYSNEIIFQDFTPLVYDSGNYEPALERALELISYREFIGTEQPRREEAGERVGIAVVNYIEGTGIGPYEGAKVTVEASGKVTVATGVGTQGQGHYTSFAQVVAEQIGVEVSDVHVVTGDTDLFYWGAGTFASRGAVVAGNAMHAAAAKVRAKILKLAGEKLEAAAEDLELLEGRVQVKGVPQTSISLGRLAAEANPMRGSVQPGTEPGLEATEYFGPERGATASGVHAMILKVDPETFLLEIEKYVVVHDCGTVINPLILDGQIQGGVAQGIGNAFYEQLHFDDNGALLNASLMDYLLPTASDVPNILSDHFVTPSPLNPLGVKGAGEAGAIPVGALFAQALDNAFRDIGLEVREIPLSPNRLFELVSEIPARETA
ncbi:MAG: xanthine dehydrogenase family protein molybdopterin-binding subunit [Caldilineaceae bacterium SB0664_bin_27]|uniref:Xanthine dehydrogenase family protein molybdopterin-binding subunit n=1 Tax=Caldilineaceae bacterium SB0664_bin_27 TaxID=2605260 RepID=A0A6B0YMR0_9CHLR|nr:xanthine dehydrogenase family protein molybdopterin-binding subunit [Caldilineaceae bacterium SB0664_bin_27]